MIFESCYWKDDLISLSDKLKATYMKLNIDCEDRYLVEFEKDIMIAAYSIRKLLNAGKVSDDIANIKINTFVYKAMRTVTKLNWHDLEKNYEKNYHRKKKYLRTICNTIIHSYCFIPGFDKYGKFRYLYFNSADQKDIEIYSITLKELSEVLIKVGSDYPNEGHSIYNPEISDYEFHSKTKYPEPWIFSSYMNRYKLDSKSVIDEIHNKFSIPKYKVEELLKQLVNMNENERIEKIIAAFLPAINNGHLEVKEISDEYNIDYKIIIDYINKSKKKV